MLWTELKDMFTLPEGVDEELLKKCAFKKMAPLQLSRRSCTPITSRRIRSQIGMIFLRLNLTRRSSNNTNYHRKPKKNLNRPRQMHQRRSTATTLGLEDIRRQLKTGRRWSRTLWIEASGRQLGNDWIDPSGGYLLTA